MTNTGFVSSFIGDQLLMQSQTNKRICSKQHVIQWKMSANKGKGFFGKLKETILRPVVTVPGGGTGGDLLECVFCKGSGVCDCDACQGTGKDSLGECLMCQGKNTLTCTVCSGIGTVDRIRRGGTDDRNEYTIKKVSK